MPINLLAGWALLFLSYGACLLATGLGWIDAPAGSLLQGYRIHAAALPLVGIAAGLALTLLRDASGAEASASARVRNVVLVLAVAALAVALLGGTATPALGGLQAGALLVCGTVTLVLAFAVLEQLRQNEGLSFESHWGGLGGNLGGWRLSTSVVLVLLLLVFAAATVSVALAPPAGGAADRKAAAPPAAAAAKAAAKPGRAARPPA
jgi:hypothetical protein